MVYLYLGFFIFLLYVIAPLWLVLLVAVTSFLTIRFSYTLRKNMRVNPWKPSAMTRLTLYPKKLARSNTSAKSVERRKFNRIAASLEVAYQVVSEKEKVDIASAEEFPGVAILPLVKRYKTGQAIIRDISEGGLAIVGEESFAVGEQLKLSVQFPEAGKPIEIQATVRSSKAVYKEGKTTFKTGLMIVDVDLEDFVHLLDYLFSQRD